MYFAIYGFLLGYVQMRLYLAPAFRMADDRWTQGRLRWDHVVVFPNAEIGEEFALPECPRWKVIDRKDLPNLVGSLKGVLLRQELDRQGSLDLMTA